MNKMGQLIRVIQPKDITRLNAQTISFTTDELAAGLYFVRFKTDVEMPLEKLIKD